MTHVLFLIGTLSRRALFTGLLVAVGGGRWPSSWSSSAAFLGFGPTEDEAPGVSPERLAARISGVAILLTGVWGALGRLERR